MKHKRFEDTPVWKDAARLFVGLDDLADSPAFRGAGDLRDQLLRATLSISNNIAEGFDRGTTNELIQYLYWARGSAGEARSMLTIMSGMRRFADLRSEIPDFRSRANSIGRELHGWASQLQTSDIAGRRHLTDAAREQYERKTRARAFEAKLAAAVDEARAERAARDEERRRAEGEAALHQDLEERQPGVESESQG